MNVQLSSCLTGSDSNNRVKQEVSHKSPSNVRVFFIKPNTSTFSFLALLTPEAEASERRFKAPISFCT